MTTTTSKKEFDAEVKDARKKAVFLTIDIDGEAVSLWFQRSKAARNPETGKWEIDAKALDKALQERADFLKRQAELKATFIVIEKGFGLCKNGSYWIQTRGFSYTLERPVKSQLAFVKADKVQDNGDGTISIDVLTANRALDEALIRTKEGGYSCEDIDFIGRRAD